MSVHTDGPWKVVHREDLLVDGWATEEIPYHLNIYAPFSEILVAEIGDKDPESGDPPDQEMLDTANLIAAAPELLNVLERIVSRIDDGFKLDLDQHPAVKEARELIRRVVDGAES